MARLIDAFTQFFDDAGDPVVSGKLYFYVSGTNNTDKATYADINEEIANTQPVLLDGAGRAPNIFGSGSYKVVLTTNNDVQIGVFDPVSSQQTNKSFSFWSALINYDSGDLVTSSTDNNYYRSLQNENENNDPTTSPEFWERVNLGTIYEKLLFTFTSDADESLSTSENRFSNIEIQNGVITTTRTLTIAGQARPIYINNLEDFPVTLNGSGETITISSNQSANLLYDGTDIIRKNYIFDKLSFTFASDANDTLTAEENYYSNIEIQTGTITATRTITIGGVARPIYVNNVNAQSVIISAGGATVTVPAASDKVVFFDATDVIELYPEFFDNSLASSGYQKLPGGKIEQWGSVTTSASVTVNWTYPFVFPNAVYRLYATPANVATAVFANINAATTTSAQVNAYDAAGAKVAAAVSLLAIGK